MKLRRRLVSCALGTLLATLQSTAMAAGAPWQTVADLPPVVGADGQTHAATCSGYPGTDARFRFWVRPGDPKKLAVVFDGGGACWDNLTCSNPFGSGGGLLTFYSPDIPASADPSRYGGMIDLERADNPVRDWTVVAIPYCTGDVHLGSADRGYRMVGHRGLPRSFTLHHRGYDNFMVVLDWITRHVPQGLTDLLVSGASAGGYGAAGLFPWLAQAYPQARLSVLADASQGVTTEGFDAGTPGRGSWNAQLPAWVFGPEPMAVRSHELVRQGAQAHPNGRFAQYTTTQDVVQIGFYGVMRLRLGPSDDPTCLATTKDWTQQMLQHLASDKAAQPNFRAYVAPGQSHTIIADDAFYAPMGSQPSMAAWMAAMLDPARGLPWDQVACPDCLVPPRCR